MRRQDALPMNQYVALLRGINVGGKNLIKMTALKECLEKDGLRDVVTYIQSGNVLFSAPASESAGLTSRIERVLAKTFSYEASVVLCTLKQMSDVVLRAPKGFGKSPAKYRYDVVFLKSPLTAATAVKSVPAKPGVDDVRDGKGVLYCSRLISRASQSRMSRIVLLPIYKNMTIRNWNTTTKLLEMMGARSLKSE
jgi:uncharacterized protein (DUF1697 family)